MARLAAAVILGGIKRIGAATSRIVPGMVAIYVGASLFVIAVNIDRIPESISLMFSMAFSEDAFYGGMLGAVVQAVQSTAVANAAGRVTASIAPSKLMLSP